MGEIIDKNFCKWC